MSGELTPLGGWLHQVELFIRRFVVLSDDQAAAVTLWVAHTHGFAAAVATAYLWISSAEMESGKTRLLEVLRLLVANPWFTGRTSTAALTRKIDKTAPSLLLDEGDPAFNGDKEYAEALRGVLNTGYRKGGAVTVCTGQGANLDVKDFSTFCPKAIAGIGRLPDTVESRSIPIRLKKRLNSEPVERFREREARAVGERLADGLAMSVEPILDELETAAPELPDKLSDRAQDVWEPLLAIADAAGGEWPKRAREAAERLSSRTEPDEGTLGVRLLADVRAGFEDRSTDRFATAELLAYLRTVEEAPWGNFKNDKPLSARTLASTLRRFEIKSRTVWLPGDSSAKGYLREQFEDAWGRYLPADPPLKTSGRQDGSTKPETADFQTSGSPPPDGYESGEKPHEQANLTDLTDTDGGRGENAALFGDIDPDPVAPAPVRSAYGGEEPA